MAVYDCISLFNELDLLEIRLNILDPYVDHFVITEGRVTFNNVPKPLFYEANKERFAKFADKIIYNVIEDMPNSYLDMVHRDDKDMFYNLCVDRVVNADWFEKWYPLYIRDTWTKECSIRPLVNAQPTDIIMLSDLDEIPRPEVFEKIIEAFATDNTKIYNLQERWYNYFFNVQKQEWWTGNIILSFENFLKTGFCELKMRRRGLMVTDSGWHFSYMGDAKMIAEKLDSIREHTWNVESWLPTLQETVDNILTSDHDVHQWPTKFTLAPINSLPQYIQDNLEKYKEYIREG